MLNPVLLLFFCILMYFEHQPSPELEGVLEDGFFCDAYIFVETIMELLEDCLLLVGEGFGKLFLMLYDVAEHLFHFLRVVSVIFLR